MKKIWIVSSIALFIVMVVVVSSLFMSDDPVSDYNFNFDHRNIPGNIANYQLFNDLEAAEANELMGELFRREVVLDQAYILEYSNPGGSHSIVWIAESSQNGKPETLLEEMQNFLSAENLLLDFGEKTISGEKVYHGVDSMGRDNYFFVNDHRFIFITTYEDRRENFIRNAVRVF